MIRLAVRQLTGGLTVKQRKMVAALVWQHCTVQLESVRIERQLRHLRQRVSRVLGEYFYFIQSTQRLYFWKHWCKL